MAYRTTRPWDFSFSHKKQDLTTSVKSLFLSHHLCFLIAGKKSLKLLNIHLFKELHQLFGFFFCDMSCYIFRYLAVFIQQLYAAKRLQISASHCIQHSDFHLSYFFFPKKQIKQNIHHVFYKNEYHRRLLSPRRAAVSTPRYFSVRYSFLSNNCSIERFLNLGMLYPNGELRAFTKSFV